MKVLIIDDSPESLKVASARLSRENVDILCAMGAKEGLELARQQYPDLILLDVDMPGMSGFDLCRIMKSDSAVASIPVIFLSGSGTPEDKIRGLDLGAVDYVTKPFDAFELRARVRAALRTKQMQDLLTEQANIDPLTSLRNRRALAARLEAEWARASRHGTSLALIMADIDYFKHVNDTHGHSVGDRLLQEVARAIAAQCRATDLPARFGGEEFAVLLPDETRVGAANFAERCRGAVEEIRLPLEHGVAWATASFGVSDSGMVTSIPALIRSADSALYAAKRSGRNRVSIAEPPLRPAQTESSNSTIIQRV